MKVRFQLPPALDFRKEADNIKEALQLSGKQVEFFSTVATRHSFEEMIRRAPRVLHISCHGIKMPDGVTSALLFENSYGAGELVTEEMLTKLLKSK